MKLLRALMLILMAFAILPWGGVAAAVQAQSAPQVVAVDEASQDRLSVPRKCRGSFLPGYPCGTDRCILAEGGGLARDFAARTGWTPVNRAGIGRTHGPPDEPPRRL
jgi:hypothetical protein